MRLYLMTMVCIFCGVESFLVGGEEGPIEKSSIGRYQLAATPTTDHEWAQLFLLDTETGTIWRSSKSWAGGKNFGEWEKLPLSPPTE